MLPFFLFVGDTARNPGRSGIQTVVRSLAAACAAQHAPARLVMWNNKTRALRTLPPEFSVGPDADPLRDPSGALRGLWLRPQSWPSWVLRGKNLPVHHHPRHRNAPAGTWVLMPELMYRGRAEQLVNYVHGHGWRLAVILYDTIPVQHPEFVPPELPATHAEYLRAFAKADLILPISEASAEDWRVFLSREDLLGPPVKVCTLACDLSGVPRTRATAIREPSAPVRLLCVSTLEPRKNHRALLAAYETAAASRPDLRLELDLVGAAYVGAADIEAEVRAAAQRLPGLRWHGQVEYEQLRSLYADCDFTVYPSVVEGFGLPVIESLWFGRPCVCANFGVMAENAAGGGCLTADVRDFQALAEAITTLASSPELRRKLASEASTRPLKTWDEYAREVLACLDPA